MARDLEAELVEHPEDRGEILIEAADAWHLAGEHDRAVELLTEAAALGGEDGGHARVALAEVLFDLDRGAEAATQLDALRADPLPDPAPYYLAGELMAERGDFEQALTWFELAAGQLTEDDIADMATESEVFSPAAAILAGRLNARQELGLPVDELDESVLALDSDFDGFGDLDARIAEGEPPAEVRVLFWPRAEVAPAHARWPELVESADADAVLREHEVANQDMSVAGVARITMVPLTTAKLADFAARTGGDPLSDITRRACLDEIVDEGGLIDWPPARNEPCWCGSAAKYKKCCGRPDSAQAPPRE
ncbi:SEC-C metal-binding domain-containing protein [Actinophytocola sp.]|uniref:SEC-C metal-binding domain-containing protein n=1 Tax=Actinophytocola sp. TaxID=1872138 RepID=UPI0025BFA148|nr:SEC-C metal-binding domain-containing protein [Actinophytocola sp.]